MFVDEDGTIKSKRATGVCSKWQRRIARSIKTARTMNMIPYDGRWDFKETDPLRVLPSALFREDKTNKVNSEIAALYRDFLTDAQVQFPNDGTVDDFFAWRTERARKAKEQALKSKAEMFDAYEAEMSQKSSK